MSTTVFAVSLTECNVVYYFVFNRYAFITFAESCIADMILNEMVRLFPAKILRGE